MKQICIDSRYITTRPSGIAEVVRALVNRAPALMPEVAFTLLKNPACETRLSTAEHVREVVVDAAANGPTTMWWLHRAVDLSGIDLFHATFNTLPAGLKMRTLTTIHDIMWLTDPAWCNPRAWGLVERQFYAHGIRRALKHSDHIATVSDATRRSIVARFPQAEARISTTLSGVSSDFHAVDVDPSALEKHGLTAMRPIVLTMGQNAPYKNHKGALEAFSRAFPDDSGPVLVFVQRQDRSRSSLSNLAEQLGIGERVHFLGEVTFDDMLQLYSAATALLHPSFCEGFGNPVAEAMACGCPVITSNCSAMPEVTGGAARLVDPYDTAHIADALREVVGDAALRDQMRAAGLARAQELSWDAFAEANVAIYRELLADA